MKRTVAFTLSGLVIAVLVALRSYFVLYGIDAQTGFYVAQKQNAATAVSMAMAGLCVVVIIVARLLPLKPAGIVRHSYPLSLLSFLMAGALFYDAAYTLFSQMELLNWADILLLVLAVLAGCSLVAHGVGLWRTLPQRVGFSALLIVLWSLARFLILFIRFNGVTKISENAFDVVAAALMMMFWLFHTKNVTGTQSKGSTGWLCGFGLTAAAASLMVSLPRYLALLTGRGDLFVYSSGPLLFNLIAPIYIFVFLILSTGAKASIPVSTDAPPVQASGFVSLGQSDSVQPDVHAVQEDPVPSCDLPSPADQQMQDDKTGENQ